MILVSPAEHTPAMRSLGRFSGKVEQYGVDAMWVAQRQLWGVQRKTWADLFASVRDDRLGKELGQATALDVKVLALEGQMVTMADGSVAVGRESWTREQVWGLGWSVRSKGWWIERTRDAAETAALCRALEAWSRKSTHHSLESRSKAKGIWGLDPTEREYALWLLQSLPGVGAGTAKAVFETLGVPFGWKVTEAELCKVPGIGKKKAAQMYRALGGVGDGTEA